MAQQGAPVAGAQADWEDYGQDLPAAGFPTVMEADILVGDSLFLGLDGEQQRALLSDESTQTAVERGDGILPAIRVKRTRGALATVDELAAVFDQCVGPASLEVSTRRGYQAAWRTVLTWGIAHRALGQLLPMSKVTLKALTQELLMVGCAAGTIKNVCVVSGACGADSTCLPHLSDAPIEACSTIQASMQEPVASFLQHPSQAARRHTSAALPTHPGLDGVWSVWC